MKEKSLTDKMKSRCLSRVTSGWTRLGSVLRTDRTLCGTSTRGLIDGSVSFPAVVHLPTATDVQIPSREAGRTVPVRVLRPDNGEQSRGIFMHAHGGGWISLSHQEEVLLEGGVCALLSHPRWAQINRFLATLTRGEMEWGLPGAGKGGGQRLEAWANGSRMTVISVGYRLAPAHPYPAAVHDCIDVAEYLASDAGQQQFGGQVLKAIDGESAGTHLAAATDLSLAKANPEAAGRLAGLVLLYVCYDLSLSTPSMVTNVPGSTAVVSKNGMKACVDAFMPPDIETPEKRRAATVSPMYEDLLGVASKMADWKLPPALFICGSTDPLVDDSVLMGSKWIATGSDAVVRIWPGAPHAFDIFGHVVKEAGEAMDVIYQFLSERT